MKILPTIYEESHNRKRKRPSPSSGLDIGLYMLDEPFSRLSITPPPPPPPPQLPSLPNSDEEAEDADDESSSLSLITTQPRRKRQKKLTSFELSLLQPYELFEHQITAIETIHTWEKNPLGQAQQIRGGLLCLQMGLGKSLIALSLLFSNPSDANAPSLFICPPTLLENIQFEAAKFFGGNIPIKVLGKDNLIRMDWTNPRLLIIASYNTILALHKRNHETQTQEKKKYKAPKPKFFFEAASLFNTRFTRIVADESQHFTNTKTKLFEALLLLKSDYRLCMTGTPIQDDISQLKSQFQFCGFDPTIPWESSTLPNPELATRVHALTYEKAGIELPPKRTKRVYLKFENDREKSRYITTKQDCANVQKLFLQKSVGFTSVLCEMAKMRQAACVSETKFQALVKIIRDDIPTPTEKVVVFSSFTTALRGAEEHIRRHIPDLTTTHSLHGGVSVKKRGRIIEQFLTDPKCRILLLTPIVGSVGLNLSAANHLVFLDPFTDAIKEQQAVARIHRIGQKKPVTIWKLIMQGTVEQSLDAVACDFVNKEKCKVLEKLLNDYLK